MLPFHPVEVYHSAALIVPPSPRPHLFAECLHHRKQSVRVRSTGTAPAPTPRSWCRPRLFLSVHLPAPVPPFGGTAHDVLSCTGVLHWLTSPSVACARRARVAARVRRYFSCYVPPWFVHSLADGHRIVSKLLSTAPLCTVTSSQFQRGSQGLQILANSCL